MNALTFAFATKRVLLVGAGGLGSPAGTLLARAGVGGIDVLDDDSVELSNLQRQTLYDETHVGQSKAQSAVMQLQRAAQAAGHAGARMNAREERLTPENALALVREFDLVVEGSDNYATKFLTADACAIARIPCVQAAAVRWVGWALGTWPGQSACLRCVFEDIPEGPDRGCATAGVIGPVVGVLGAVQAAIALRMLSNTDTAVRAAGVLHHYRALPGALRQSRVTRSPTCPTCNGEITQLDRARYMPRVCAA
ncbi:MAG: hypothetical protein RL701_4456 [Pseudomonadota bacterium]|jgi:adenylyltransferase/sulfurtransferase